MFVGGAAEILATITRDEHTLPSNNYNIIILYFKPSIILHWGACMAAADQGDVAAGIHLHRW